MAVTPLTDPVRRGGLVSVRSRGGLHKAKAPSSSFDASGCRPLSTASHVGLSAQRQGNPNDPTQSTRPRRRNSCRRTHSLRLPPVWQAGTCSTGVQPALHWRHGPLGSASVTDARDRARGHSVQQRSVSSQLRRGSDLFRANGGQRGLFYQCRWDCRRSMCSAFRSGGFVAQEITLQAPDLCEARGLVGTGPRSGEGMATLTPEAQEIFGATYDDPRSSLASLALHAVRNESCGRPRVPQTAPFRLRAETAIPRSTKRSRPPDRGDQPKWGAPREKPFELSEGDSPAALVRERRQCT